MEWDAVPEPLPLRAACVARHSQDSQRISSAGGGGNLENYPEDRRGVAPGGRPNNPAVSLNGRQRRAYAGGWGIPRASTAPFLAGMV